MCSHSVPLRRCHVGTANGDARCSCISGCDQGGAPLFASTIRWQPDKTGQGVPARPSSATSSPDNLRRIMRTTTTYYRIMRTTTTYLTSLSWARPARPSGRRITQTTLSLYLMVASGEGFKDRARLTHMVSAVGPHHWPDRHPSSVAQSRTCASQVLPDPQDRENYACWPGYPIDRWPEATIKRPM